MLLLDNSNGCTPATPQVTQYFYDWEDRLVATKQGSALDAAGDLDPLLETDGLNRPITYFTSDNLGDVTGVYTYDGVKYAAPEPPQLAENGEPKIAPGWYAISVNFVRGLPYFSYKGDGTKVSYGQDALVAFQKLKPVATAGYSIYIYHVE